MLTAADSQQHLDQAPLQLLRLLLLCSCCIACAALQAALCSAPRTMLLLTSTATHSTSSLIGPALRMQRAQVHTPSPKPE